MWEVVALGRVCANVKVHGSDLVWAISDPDTTEIQTKTVYRCLPSRFFSHTHTKQNPSKASSRVSAQHAAMHLLPVAHRKGTIRS